MNNISGVAYALAVIAALLLAVAGTKLLRAQQNRTRGVLMIVAALVLLMNVMIWTV